MADKLPTGIALTALSLAFREDPHSILDRLRTEAPVHRDPQFDSVVLTRYADGRAVLADRTLAKDLRKANPGSPIRMALGVDRTDRPWVPSMLHQDDPDHKRIRGLVSQAFNQRAVDAFRPRLRQIAEGLLDAIGDADRFDVIAAYARPLPVIAIAEMLGVDPAQQAEFTQWSDGVTHVFSPMRTKEQQQTLDWAGDCLAGYFAAQIEARRGKTGTDLMSRLVNAEDGGVRLTDQDIIMTCNLLLLAGNLTTTDMIGNAVVALLRHPDQMAAMAANPARMVEEVLRYDPPVTITNRIATEAREIDGVPVLPGQQITVSLAAAAHDPAVNPAPAVFDINRTDGKHLSFGGGAHFCLGAPLARMEGEVAIPLLFERFPGLRLALGQTLRRKATPTFNGFAELWVTQSSM